MIQAALNGGRSRDEHPAVPESPEQIAVAARDAAAAGAACVHIHVRDADGRESIAPADVARTLAAISRAAPGLPVSVSTGAWIVPDPAERQRIVRSWTLQPAEASVNFHEPGAAELALLLYSRGIGFEAGVLSVPAVENLLRSGLASRARRLLIEPLEPALDVALENLDAMVALLDDAQLDVPRVVHGFDSAAWKILETALARGWSVRVGLEDVLVLPDGSPAADNAALVAAAARLAAQFQSR